MKTERLEIRITKAELVQLDDLRRHELDVPSRGEMLRRLIRRTVTKPST